MHQRIDLLDPGLDHTSQRLARQQARRAVAQARHFKVLARVGQHLLGHAVLDLDLLGVLGRRAKRHRNVAGDQVAGDRDHRGVAYRTLGVDADVGGTGADVDQRDAEHLLVFGQHGGGAGTGVEHQAIDLETAAAHAFEDVLGCTLGTGDDVNPDLEPTATHAHRLSDLMVVDHELLRLDQQQTLVVRDVDRLGGLDHPVDVQRRDLSVVANDHHAGRVLTADVTAGDAGVDPLDLAGGHHLGLFQRSLDALHRGIDVDHHAALEAMRRGHAQTGQPELARGHHLGGHHHHLGSADVESDDQVLVFFGHGWAVSSV